MRQRRSLNRHVRSFNRRRLILARAKLNLEYCNIYSPVDGVVISRNVDVGQTIAASLQSPTLFTIANDLARMQVNANIDEADIGNISDQADVRIYRRRLSERGLSEAAFPRSG
jgi:HlyD family secretion protein